MLIIFNDIIDEMFNNKKLQQLIIELLIRSRKIYISLVFTTQTYFAAPKGITLISTPHFIMEIPIKR